MLLPTLPLQGTCCVIRLRCRFCPDDAIGRTNKRGSSVYGKRAQRSALGALRKFCWSGILQGCTTHGPARADGRPAGPSMYPLVRRAEIRYSIPST